jgi:hypothetical protein
MYLLLQNMPLAGIDLQSIIFGLIIFGSIIGKIKKASSSGRENQKGATGQSGPPSSTPSKSTSEVQTELEDFLKTLVGGNAPVTAPTPQAPPPMPAVIKQTPKNKPLAPPLPQKPVASRTSTKTEEDYTCDATMKLETLNRKSAFAKSISTDLRENMSVRKAIALREILGPPIALRR